MNDKFLEILSKSSGRTITRPYDGSLLIKLDLPELEKFAELVKDAEANCPISKVLNATISVDYSLNK